MPHRSNSQDEKPAETQRAADGESRFDKWWTSVVSEWQPLWLRFEALVDETLRLLESAGRLFMNVVAFVQGVMGFLGRHGGRWLVFPALAGAVSPPSSGYGIHQLGNSDWGIWAPIFLLPLLALLLRAMLRSILEESERNSRRREAEHRDPKIANKLADERDLRQMASEEVAVASSGEARLGKCERVHDIMKSAHSKVAGADPFCFTLALLSLMGDRMVAIATRGHMDDELREAIEVPWVELAHDDGVFKRALEPLQYRHESFPVCVGEHHCVLIGLSGATISSEAALTVSEAATDLVLWLAYEEKAPKRIAREA